MSEKYLIETTNIRAFAKMSATSTILFQEEKFLAACLFFFRFGLFDYQSGTTLSARRLLTWCWIVFVNLQIIVRANRLKAAFIFCCIVELQSFIFLDVDGLQLDEVGSFGNWQSWPCHPKGMGHCH